MRFALKGLILDNDRCVTHSVSFYNLFVASIRSVDQQRNSRPKTGTAFQLLEFSQIEPVLTYVRMCRPRLKYHLNYTSY